MNLVRHDRRSRTSARVCLGCALFTLAACAEHTSARVALEDTGLVIERAFPSDGLEGHTFDSCITASPVAIESRGQDFVIVAAGAALAAIDPESGELAWQIVLDAGMNQLASIIATPVAVGSRLVVTFERINADGGARMSHHVAVVDLDARALDRDFAELELHGSQPSFDGDDDVEFAPSNAVSRAALAYASVPDRELGFVYVSFGNAKDIQPWHGWVFEVDLEAWRADVTNAISGLLLTTPETACGAPGESGARDIVCGAGVWAPTGPKVFETNDGYELIVPTGNGLLDLERRDYANSLLRLGRGLGFDPQCDVTRCSGFDPLEPALDCLESCGELFVPHLPSDAPALAPEDGSCDGKSYLECVAAHDWDLGANSPAKAELTDGRAVYVMPSKDGAVYLVDGEHMGTMLDRLEVAAACGTKSDACSADWAGTMVTEPALTKAHDGTPLALVPTFAFDHSHPAGVVALRIEAEPAPHLRVAWRMPKPSDANATRWFRHHPSRITLFATGGEDYAWVVDAVASGRGALNVIRVRDGVLAARIELAGAGQRFVAPLALGKRVYVVSCGGSQGPSELEAYSISEASAGP